MAEPKVADMSLDEFREIVREAVVEAVSEIIVDPDQGLDLRDDFEEELRHSLATAASGEKTGAVVEA